MAFVADSSSCLGGGATMEEDEDMRLKLLDEEEWEMVEWGVIGVFSCVFLAVEGAFFFFQRNCEVCFGCFFEEWETTLYILISFIFVSMSFVFNNMIFQLQCSAMLL